MGASESSPATPTCKPLLNRHLGHVSDPRSPTAGILRTPIEVDSSPQATPLSLGKQDELVANNQNPNWDPRSPTPGISRTPMKAVVADTMNCLVKQLSEVFMPENMEEELPLEESHHESQTSEVTFATEETSREKAAPRDTSQESPLGTEGERNEPLHSSVSVVAATRPAHLASVLHPTGSKPTRRRGNNKILATSMGPGRSPLSILQDDNSPNSLASHQIKRCPSVADDQAERKEGGLSAGRSKAGSYNWNSLNKENQQRHVVEY
ncbi:Cell division cycle-associated protein 3 [Varanus komodoensis]|uniref:cell division cycle-associated protein 3 n=1 Tax=Varanus komodoensis TaxID=61221 RepID=UPI001CF7BC9F|nr:cell division cycle-associated protein 3 [Varanus komodoensis]KAF7238135.1 Cell division cycle-associated protein 3 [Varanus komodoensis]